jgi:site-specific DNA recombinase
VIQPLRCAIYARFSSEKQNSLSITQQIRKCREYADREGLLVLDEHIYADEAISGATDDRTGLRRMLSAAKQKPRPIDVILCDDTSRLSRRLTDSLRIFEQMQALEIRIVFVAQGIDTTNEQAELLVATHGIVDSLYIKDLAKRTFRGVEHLALNGLHTGGRVFGYRRVPIQSTTERDSYGRPKIEGVILEVDPDQPRAVHRIFERYATGHSLKRIAIDLNHDRVVSPQPQKGRIARSWCPSSVRHILHNERYRGVVFWGRTQKVRSETGRRISRRKPESQWRRKEIPEQRIVSDELWNAVRQRMQAVNELYSLEARRPGILRARAASSPYIFSGLLKCSLCGASVTIVAGCGRSRQDVRYGCSMHYNRGRGACSNTLLIARRTLEEELLAGLQAKVLDPDVIAYTLDRFEIALKGALAARHGDAEARRRQEAALEKKIANLTSALADGYRSPAILADLARYEAELVEIRRTAAASRPEAIAIHMRDTRRFVESRLRQLQALFGAEAATIRAELSKHVQKIALTPEGRSYVASGAWNVLGVNPWMVPGARIAPRVYTFSVPLAA